MDEFESIFMADSAVVSEGYKHGIENGKILGEKEGFSMGKARGKELSQEVGFIFGFCLSHMAITENCDDKKCSAKLKDTFQKTVILIEDFVKDSDPTNMKFDENIDKIRSNFKRICSILKINYSISTQQTLSF